MDVVFKVSVCISDSTTISNSEFLGAVPKNSGLVVVIISPSSIESILIFSVVCVSFVFVISKRDEISIDSGTVKLLSGSEESSVCGKDLKS